MYIKTIIIENFRMLKKFSIDLENELSLVIGKNNVGKTSLLAILDKFLSDKDFSFNDFNLDFQDEIVSLIQGNEINDEAQFAPKTIKMLIVIKYDENDSLENIGNVLMSLDTDNYYFCLGFEYSLSYENYKKCLKKYKEVHNKNNFDIYDWLRRNCKNYFKTVRKSVSINKDGVIDETKFIDLERKDFSLSKVIAFKYINARRNVDNKERDKTLSAQTSDYYNTQKDNIEFQNATLDIVRTTLKEQDEKLSSMYERVFKDVIDKIALLGGLYPNESSIKIKSSLKEKNLLQDNTTVLYTYDNNTLPENFNGLGYMNLISMIFEIEIIRKQFEGNGNRRPADINLLFIEEPEAHTHPQMQYVFIKNIKTLLKEGISYQGTKKPLQYIVTTHSAHIVADCDFNDIKYLRRIEGKNETIAKNMQELEKSYENDKTKYLKFLKQYLTINRSELFFADKVICIEGDTERILLPAMMKKYDDEHLVQGKEHPLLSQNISIIETGAYAHIFEIFFRFIGIMDKY